MLYNILLCKRGVDDNQLNYLSRTVSQQVAKSNSFLSLIHLLSLGDIIRFAVFSIYQY